MSFILWACLLLVHERAEATHAAGADLTYTCLGGNVYRIEASFYRDCSGSNEPSSVTVRYSSVSCGYSYSAVAAKAPAPNGMEITMPCVTQPSSCNGGFTTGLRKWVYRAVVTLPAACSDWVFSYKVCCRNCSITTIQNPCATGSEIYVESRLNNLAAPGNSSPYFNNDPIAIMPVGQPFNYHQSVTDPDGDSLHYELITPMTSAATGVTFIPPATPQSPLASSTPFTINQRTGDIMFTPSMIQIGILAVKVSEYRNGLFIGSTIRDMQVYTYNSGNTVPSLSGLAGSNTYQIQACAGQQLCITLDTYDPDSAQVVSAMVSSAIPGAAVTVSQGPRPQIQFCWTPDSNDVRATPYILRVMLRDDACPVNGIRVVSVPVYVSGFKINTGVLSNSCPGEGNGSAQIIAQTGSIASVAWNTVPVQNTAVATGLLPGTYSVVATDTAGCMITDSVSVGSWPAISVLTNVVPVSCAGVCGGSISANVTGGAAPFSYNWNNGSVLQSVSGLCPGGYSLTVTDANGCKASDSISLAALSSIQVTGNVTMPLCGGNSGASIDVTVSGNVGVVTYVWSNGSATEDVSGLQPGIYTLTVSDSLGCNAAISFNVSQSPLPLTISQFTQHISCNGGNNGSASLTVSGGTPPYQYLWQGGASLPFLNGLTAGTYLYTVTDINGCTEAGEVTLLEPDSVLTGIVTTDQIISCFGGNNGVLSVHAEGGTPGYTYLWSTGAGTASVSGLPAGNYTVTVTDASGCIKLISADLNQPSDPLMVGTEVIHAECLADQKGAILLSPQGGSPAYLYQWSNGSVSKDITGLEAGTYSVIVTDMSGCTKSLAFTIEDHSKLQLSNSGLVTICVGQTTTLLVDSLIPNHQFQWYYSGNPLLGAVGTSLNTPAAGSYFVEASGPCGTFISDTVQVLVKSVENASVSSGKIICPPENTRLFASGGVYYSWSPDTGLNNPLIPDPVADPMVTTLYNVTITDAFGCSMVLPVQVMVNCDSLFIPNGFSPNADGTNDGFVIDGIENYPDNKLWVYNRWGALVYKATGYNNIWDGISNIRGAGQGSRVPAGTYFYILDLGDGTVPRNGYLILR